MKKSIMPVIMNFFPEKVQVMYAKTPAKKKAIKAVKKGRSKNPVKRTSRNLEKAKKNYKEFTGHSAGFIDKIDMPEFKEGFVFGECDGILYTTVRDGRTEHYIHEFKNSSRPVLASNHDGAFITLIGGNYKFTDRGIVDK